jgi:hypothetical protein
MIESVGQYSEVGTLCIFCVWGVTVPNEASFQSRGMFCCPVLFFCPAFQHFEFRTITIVSIVIRSHS